MDDPIKFALMLLILGIILIVSVPALAYLAPAMEPVLCSITVNIRTEISKSISSDIRTGFFRGAIMSKLPFACKIVAKPFVHSQDWELKSLTTSALSGSYEFPESNVEFDYDYVPSDNKITYTIGSDTTPVFENDKVRFSRDNNLLYSYFNYTIRKESADNEKAHVIYGPTDALDEFGMSIIDCFKKFGSGESDPFYGAKVEKPFTCSAQPFDFTEGDGEKVSFTFRNLVDYLNTTKLMGGDQTYLEALGNGGLMVCGMTKMCYFGLTSDTIAAVKDVSFEWGAIGVTATEMVGEGLLNQEVDLIPSGMGWEDDIFELVMGPGGIQLFPMPLKLCVPFMNETKSGVYFHPDMVDANIMHDMPVIGWFADIPVLNIVYDVIDDHAANIVDKFANSVVVCNYQAVVDEILDAPLSEGLLLTGYSDGYFGVEDDSAAGSWEMCGRNYQIDIVVRKTFAEVVSGSRIGFSTPSDSVLLCVRDPAVE